MNFDPDRGQSTAPAALPWTLPQDEMVILLWTTPSTAVVFDPDAALAFTAAGYDAAELAELWGHPGDLDYAKVAGGQMIIQGQALGILPGSAPDHTDAQSAWVAFTGAGHGVDDALQLAALWNSPSGFEAARQAGAMILDGESLPSDATLDAEPPVDAAAAEDAYALAG